MYRSEREAKGPGVVIATLKEGNKDITLSTLDLSDIRLETQSLLNQLLTNIGVTISNDGRMVTVSYRSDVTFVVQKYVC